MTKVLAIGADHTNGRDGIIVQGIRNLFPEYKLTYVLIDDFKPQAVQEFFPEQDFDLILYCGTPFLWDQMFRSHKYKNTMACRNAHPEAKMVWMGIGSCLNLSDANGPILRSNKEQEQLFNTFGNDKVIVRDSLAHELLNQSSVKNTFLPCPSYFCFNSFGNMTDIYNTLFFYEPSIGISSGDWNPSSKKYKDYIDINRAFIELYNPVIYCTEVEKIYVLKHFGTMPVITDDVKSTLFAATHANHVLSGRVHNAVPCLAKNKKVMLLPIDTRSLVVSDFGGKIANSVDSLKEFDYTNIDFNHLRSKYKD